MLPGGCKRGDEECHFLHTEAKNEEAQGNIPQDFIQVPQNTAPPNLRKDRGPFLDMMKQYMMHQQQLAQQFMQKLCQ